MRRKVFIWYKRNVYSILDSYVCVCAHSFMHLSISLKVMMGYVYFEALYTFVQIVKDYILCKNNGGAR